MFYWLAVVAGYAAFTASQVLRTPLRTGQILLFVALVACGAVCIEATRRLGVPAGVSRDLLSAWWLPIALLLPPSYALAAPVPLGIMLQVRVPKGFLFRRVFSIAALGLAGAVASEGFILLGRGASVGPAAGHPHVWLTSPATVAVGVACAGFFTIVNIALVALAAWLADRQTAWRELLWDKERLLLDVVELCVGVLVTIACVASPVLLLLALPPVVVLQRSLLHKQLRAAARIDAKTGLLNAASWQREADAELGRALRTGGTLAVLLVDIDHFKRINDTCGHLAGDQVLAALSTALLHEVRACDLVGRFGGEEFVALLRGTTVTEACQVAERMRTRVSEVAVPVDGVSVTVTVSIGIAMLHAHGRDLFELLAAADLALYRAKESGRDRVCLFSRGDRLPVPGERRQGEPEAAGH